LNNKVGIVFQFQTALYLLTVLIVQTGDSVQRNDMRSISCVRLHRQNNLQVPLHPKSGTQWRTPDCKSRTELFDTAAITQRTSSQSATAIRLRPEIHRVLLRIFWLWGVRPTFGLERCRIRRDRRDRSLDYGSVLLSMEGESIAIADRGKKKPRGYVSLRDSLSWTVP